MYVQPETYNGRKGSATCVRTSRYGTVRGRIIAPAYPQEGKGVQPHPIEY